MLIFTLGPLSIDLILFDTSQNERLGLHLAVISRGLEAKSYTGGQLMYSPRTGRTLAVVVPIGLGRWCEITTITLHVCLFTLSPHLLTMHPGRGGAHQHGQVV
jgi:hypothetical protein